MSANAFYKAPHMLEKTLIESGFVSSKSIIEMQYPYQNVHEPLVFESPFWFWVVIRDQRSQFGDPLRIEKCRPYRWKGDCGNGVQTAYGWIDEGDNVVFNAYESIDPNDNCQVVLCRQIECD